MEELDKIIKGLKETIKNESLIITDDLLFEDAVKIFISDRINDSMKKTTPQNVQSVVDYNKIKNVTPVLDKIMATPKQIDFLKKSNYKNPEKLSSKEAREIIHNYIENLKKKNI